MSVRAASLALLLALLGASFAWPGDASAQPASFSDRQMLVMLRMPPPHYRPDADYTGSYGSRGRDARRRIAEAIAQRHGLTIVDDWPMPALGVDCFVMEAPAGAALQEILERLSREARVESVQAVNLFRVLASDPLYPLQPAAKAWHLDELHRIATGRHVRIVAIDTAIEADHPDLAGQVAWQRDFVGDGSQAAELHGTAVAGIIAARAGNGVGVAGIAPAAQIVGFRACWQTGLREASAICSSFTLAKALQAALDSGARIVNLSIGGPYDRLLERLIDAGVARGMTIVAAVDAKARDGGFPASHRSVLAVAAEDVQDSAAAALRAPARDVPTSLVGRQWGFVTGTSYAAAHVTGLVALLQELAPGIDPRRVRDALGAPAGREQGNGQSSIVDACAAVAKIAGTCACACAATRATALLSP
jgi:subtilisin family serine protease